MAGIRVQCEGFGKSPEEAFIKAKKNTLSQYLAWKGIGFFYAHPAQTYAKI